MLACAALGCVDAHAQDAAPSPGLRLTLSPVDRPAEPFEIRTSRLLALRVPAGQPVSPWAPPGPFRARWDGVIQLEHRDYYVFHAVGEGRFVLKVADEAALDVALKPDAFARSAEEIKLSGVRPNAVEAVLTQTDPNRPAWVRVFWSTEEIPRESVSPAVFHHMPTEAEQKWYRVREGRALFAQGLCVRCHRPDPNVLSRGMRELAVAGPSLLNIDQRVHRNWLAHWVNDPKALRPAARMPRVLHGETSAQDAADIAAHLIPKDEPGAPLKGGDVQRGEALYQGLGCVACHTTAAPKDGAADGFGRIPQHRVAAKWKPEALKAFLLNPSEHHPASRMPNFRLSEAEASALAAYVLSESKNDLPAFEALAQADPERGKQRFSEVGCADCHTQNPGNTASTLKAPGFENIFNTASEGCLSEQGAGPRYAWSTSQRESLEAFMKASGAAASLARRVDAPFARRQAQDLRCAACHRMDGAPSIWEQVLDQREGPPILPKTMAQRMGLSQVSERQLIPQMTWFGEKFKPDWMRAFIAGRVKEKPRPGLLARMPGFGAHAEAMAAGLAHQHGLSHEPAPMPKVDDAKAQVGETLVGQSGGLNCVSCHAAGEARALGGDLLETVNFRSIPKRLRREFYLRWMLNPPRLEPRTMMPPFAPGGKSPLRDVYGGDGLKQFDAIWQHMRSVP